MRDLIFQQGPNAPVRVSRRVAFKDDEAAFRAGAWFLATQNNTRAMKFCRDHDVPYIRAQTEGVNTIGGALVPNELLSAIIALREVTGAFRAAADIRPMGSDTTLIARRTAGLTAYFSAEGAALTASQAAWDGVNLTAKKLATFTLASSELDDDSIIDLGEWIAVESAFSFAVREDDCGFNGDGTSTYGGIKGIATLFGDGQHNAGKYTATGHTTFDAVTATDLQQTMGLAPAMSLARAAWFTSPMGFALMFCRLAASGGGILMMPDATGRLRPSYLGIPVITTQAITNASNGTSGKLLAAFGDLSLAATIGDRREVTLARSDQRYFDSNQVGFRVTERVDIIVHDVGDNTTAGPIVGLVAG